ncbi:MAG: hypothetical protein QOK23_4586 [Gammaproteobacteria bacterium]|jgi:hypothetical protein|nr:hypothetical protein [Gammaproteobacteria bacterium]
MPTFPQYKRGALLIAVLILSGCATEVSIADLSGPNYGLRLLAHFDASLDPDPTALANGIYASKPLQDWCYRCYQAPDASAWSP